MWAIFLIDLFIMNPYPIYDQNSQHRYSMTKTTEKAFCLGPHIPQQPKSESTSPTRASTFL